MIPPPPRSTLFPYTTLFRSLYKEQNHHGYDLHPFSKENIYAQLFYPFRELVSPEFRFFSMNGKRITSERKFYFETWALHRPPHGAEDVLSDSRLSDELISGYVVRLM